MWTQFQLFSIPLHDFLERIVTQNQIIYPTFGVLSAISITISSPSSIMSKRRNLRTTYQGPSPTMSGIPTEIITQILAYTMHSTTPLDLEWFTALGDGLDSFLRDWPITEQKLQKAGQPPQHPTTIAAKEAFIASLPAQEHEAYLYWLLINRTCFRFRSWGKETFYREKVFIIRPEFLAALRAGKVKGMSASEQRIALQRISHVIVPIPSFKNASPFLALPRFHASPRLETLGILRFYSFEEDKDDGIDAAQIVRVDGNWGWRMSCGACWGILG